jgi:hypothetical protein
VQQFAGAQRAKENDVMGYHVEGQARVWLVQCKCPKNHCIMALAFEDDPGRPDLRPGHEMTLRMKVGDMIVSGSINPHCAICLEPWGGWRYESRPTKYRTMAEAKPALLATEAKQNFTRGMVQGGFVDPNRWREQ